MDKTDREKILLILNILMALEKYGVPAVRKIVDELENRGDPTLEDINALGQMLKEPEAYFKQS